MHGLQKLNVAFFSTDAGNEPVREWLRALPIPDRKAIGDDICTLMNSNGVACARIRHSLVLSIGGKVHVRLQVLRRKYRRDRQTWRRAQVDMASIDWLLMARLEDSGTVCDFLLADSRNYACLPEWIDDGIPSEAERIASAAQLAARLSSICGELSTT